jgi:transcriptional regulator with XRE-family HTH domain
LIFTSIISKYTTIFDVFINMKTLFELGEAVAARRRALGLKQALVASKAGVTGESLSRFERGRSSEFGSRKLLAVLAVLGMELEFAETGMAGSLDELRKERGGA